MTVGSRIKRRRTELSLSVDELAKMLNKNRATIYRYEKGEIENLPVDVLEPLARALSTTPQYLMGWEDIAVYGTRVTEGYKESIYFGVNEKNVEHVERWHEVFGIDPLNDDEFEKLIEYAKFLISMRKEK